MTKYVVSIINNGSRSNTIVLVDAIKESYY
mgnify:CR=1 FL=1